MIYMLEVFPYSTQSTIPNKTQNKTPITHPIRPQTLPKLKYNLNETTSKITAKLHQCTNGSISYPINSTGESENDTPKTHQILPHTPPKVKTNSIQ